MSAAVLLFAAQADAGDGADAWALVEESEGPKAAFSGDFQNRSTADFEADDEFEDVFTTRELLYGKAQFTLSKTVSVTFSALGQYEARANRDFRYNGSDYGADVEELYTDLHFGKLDLRLGQQLVTWGKTDVISPTDTINSQDFRHVIDTELGHVKIPNLMTKADYYPKNFHLEAIFIPFLRPSKLSFVGGDWALLGNRVPVTSVNGLFDLPPELQRFLAFMDRNFPEWDDDLEELLSGDWINSLGPTTPPDDLKHWEAAARAGATVGPCNGSVSYFYNYGDLPILYINPNLIKLYKSIPEGESLDVLGGISNANRLTPLIGSRYEQQHQIGADFSANLGPSVLRAEGTYVLGSRMYNTDLEVVKAPMLTYTVSADYQLPHDTTFALQFLQAYMTNWTKDLLSGRAYDFLVAYAHTTFVDGKLEAYAQLLYDATNWSAERWGRGEIFGEDFQTSGKASYLVATGLRLGVGAVVFGGPRTQLLAIAHNRSFAFFDLKYSF